MVLELDKDVEKFLGDYINSFATWDLFVFFEKNPNVPADVDALSQKLKRSKEEVQKALDELVKKGVVKKEAHDGKGYVYTPNMEIKRAAHKFVESLDEREKRLLYLTALLEKGVRE